MAYGTVDHKNFLNGNTKCMVLDCYVMKPESCELLDSCPSLLCACWGGWSSKVDLIVSKICLKQVEINKCRVNREIHNNVECGILVVARGSIEPVECHITMKSKMFNC